MSHPKENVEIQRLKRRINSPKTDLLETEKTYIVRVELAYRELKWELKDEQYLFMSTDKNIDFDKNEIKVIYSETKYGIQSRRVKLPGKVVKAPIREDYKDGVLIMEFTKK